MPRSAPTGATLFGRTRTCFAEAKRRLALKPGEHGHSRGCARRGARLAGGEDGTVDPVSRKSPTRARNVVGNYQQHVYGEKEYGGTQVLKLPRPFQKVGMPGSAAGSSLPRSPSRSSTCPHGGLADAGGGARCDDLRRQAQRPSRRDDDHDANEGRTDHGSASTRRR